ncbi:hypothetical protein JVT61DRAFT_7516 [Boletus reticuloceps]|uniref:Uncharacterized protein n=1 Tax=Boletus reticuloceps TaxID=495285 RepID=A0A8I3A5X7_9AGAM|nr:hypothetical protein JVT61DRAFT_7516 [Boletus reticuloceps]
MKTLFTDAGVMVWEVSSTSFLGDNLTDLLVWQYPHVGSSWINAVRGHTWPLAGSIDPVTPPSTPSATASATPAPPPTTSTTTSTTSSPTSTAPSGSGNCDGVSAWVNNVVVSIDMRNHAVHAHLILFFQYVSGNKVTYEYVPPALFCLSRPGAEISPSGDLWTANQWKQDEVPGGRSFYLSMGDRGPTCTKRIDLSGGWTNDAKCT